MTNCTPIPPIPSILFLQDNHKFSSTTSQHISVPAKSSIMASKPYAIKWGILATGGIAQSPCSPSSSHRSLTSASIH